MERRFSESGFEGVEIDAGLKVLGHCPDFGIPAYGYLLDAGEGDLLYDRRLPESRSNRERMESPF